MNSNLDVDMWNSHTLNLNSDDDELLDITSGECAILNEATTTKTFRG